MGDRVHVRQAVTTVEADAGTTVWLDDSPHVAGMVAGGYWEILERVKPRAKAVVKDGKDQAGPVGSEGGDQPDSGA